MVLWVMSVAIGLTLSSFADVINPTTPNAANKFDGAALSSEAIGNDPGKAFSINIREDGAVLDCGFQKISGQVTSEGLWINSLTNPRGDRFQVTAIAFERNGASVMTLSAKGSVQVQNTVARWKRYGITEEYSASINGIRQDFVIEDRPAGDGIMHLRLRVSGATATEATCGTILTLPNSGREIAFSRIKVWDSTGKELPATVQTTTSNQIAINLNDQGAVYPVRIDPTFSDANWLSMGSYPAAAAVNAIVVNTNKGLVYIGGSFTWLGKTLVNYVAVWNGTNWSGLGSGMDNKVNALALDRSGNLFAAGSFTTAGGVSAARIACWNGSNWTNLGSTTMSGAVLYSLVVGTNGNLYAGGNFSFIGSLTTSGVACWDGNSWSALGSGVNSPVTYRKVYALVCDSSGNLYAGGTFTNVGGIALNYIARWDGNSWSALGQGMSGAVSALKVDLAGNLYAGCLFTNAGGASANYVAKWDGNSWSPLGIGVNGNITALAIDNSGRVYAGGLFSMAGGLPQKNIAAWDGTSWQPLSSGMDNSVLALACDGISSIYAGGSFTVAGNSFAYNISKWNGAAWVGLPTLSQQELGLSGQINAMTLDRAGNLYAGGTFATAAGQPVNNVAKWNGTNWTDLGRGLDGTVNALAFDNNSNLFVGGSFANAGGAPATNIAKWDGNNWSALGLGMNGTVNSLVIDAQNNVYAGGSFTMAGGQTASFVATWDGGSWAQVGGGLDNPVSGLTLDSSGNLYAGGFLTVLSFFSGAPFGDTHIAGWNGNAWYGMGDIGNVSALTVDASGTLYAGGNFVMAKWSGNSWDTLGAGINGAIGNFTPPYVYAMVSDTAGNLYITGAFNAAGGTNASCIAMWNGVNWSSLGSGINNIGDTLALDKTGKLYVGGSFTSAGTNASPFLAVANVGPAIAVQASDGTTLLNGANTIDLGAVPVGSTSTNRLTFSSIFMQNIEGVNFRFSSSNSYEFRIEGPNLPATIQGVSNLTFNLLFAPATNGLRSSWLQITSSAPFNSPFTINLNGIGLETTTISVDATSPITYGDPVSLFATINPVPDGGTVQFYDNGLPLGAEVPVNGGQVPCPQIVIPVGMHLISARYSGTSVFGSSISLNIFAELIAQRSVNLSGSRNYDATISAPAEILTVTNAVGADQVQIISGVGILEGASVGLQSIVSFGNLTLDGANATNYTLTAASGSVLIIAKPPGVGSIIGHSVDILKITFNGSPGGQYHVQTSSNLVDWQDLSTNTCGTAGSWTVTNNTSGSKYFFRAVLPRP